MNHSSRYLAMVSDWVAQFSLQLLPLSRDFESCNPPYQLGCCYLLLFLGILSEFEGHADLNHPFYVHAQLFLKPVVHRVTTINGTEQSLQRSNLYRRKPAEAGSRILRKNYSKTYTVGKAAPENIRRADADKPWTILTEKRLRLASTPPPWDYLHGRYNLCCLFDPFYVFSKILRILKRNDNHAID
ncbi:hypothetical protein T02_8967 [Trichinella nativa]|uniref:Uncharacterized protein n=1 Tax=Trichinella nativa TaxID=6335 RepID=A0A0V1KJH2_9BILA|nr:hypothetical protein T02_8967 [Trichinella nativa]